VPRLRFTRENGEDFIVDLYETATSTSAPWAPATDIVVLLVPGEYAIEFIPASANHHVFGESFPIARSPLLNRRIDADGPLAVDIPRVRVTVDTTLAGAALPRLVGTTSNPHIMPQVRFARVDGGSAEVDLYATTNPWEPAPPTQVFLVPGEYDILYVTPNAANSHIFGETFPSPTSWLFCQPAGP
jgi:hypothetical protein